MGQIVKPMDSPEMTECRAECTEIRSGRMIGKCTRSDITDSFKTLKVFDDLYPPIRSKCHGFDNVDML
jgi:hypothetical protein